jgi:hypothetical protein
MLVAVLRSASIVDESDGRVRLAFPPAQRAAAAAHLSELKPFFIRATGRRDLDLSIAGPGDGPGEADGAPEHPRTRADADLDHPLVRSVAELFEATPKRVEPRR